MYNMLINTKSTRTRSQCGWIENTAVRMETRGHDLEYTKIVLLNLIDYFGTVESLLTVANKQHYYNWNAARLSLTANQIKFFDDLRKVVI